MMYGKNNSSCHHADHYDTKEAAEQAAEMRGMSGAHTMDCDGTTVWMPGSSHSAYMDSKEPGYTSSHDGGDGEKPPWMP